MARGILRPLKTYLFKDHDPILDRLDRCYEIAGISGSRKSLEKVSADSGVSQGTLWNYRLRGVRNPQHSRVMAALRSTGAVVRIHIAGQIMNVDGTHMASRLPVAKKIIRKVKKKAK